MDVTSWIWGSWSRVHRLRRRMPTWPHRCGVRVSLDSDRKDQRTVQEIPLNGRHFLDMGFLVPGTLTPPQNANLAAPLRGQGFFGFNTAGGREDTINFMVNGINLNDFGGGNQITFQPTIGTIDEFKVDNSTFNAEYGFKSGAIVNMATRSGTNQWHGEMYEYLRNSEKAARTFGNPIGVADRKST